MTKQAVNFQQTKGGSSNQSQSHKPKTTNEEVITSDSDNEDDVGVVTGAVTSSEVLPEGEDDEEVDISPINEQEQK